METELGSGFHSEWHVDTVFEECQTNVQLAEASLRMSSRQLRSLFYVAELSPQSVPTETSVESEYVELAVNVRID